MTRAIERALVIVGVACLGWYALAAADAAFTEHELRTAAERALAASDPSTAPGDTSATDAGRPPAETLIGLLEIPRLGLSTPVVEGDDANALRGAAGHLPDTPRPWEPGNSAIAAHRDGIFGPLRNVRVGDEVRVQTPRGDFRYTVTGTRIVPPSDVSVLKPGAGDMLTLITCYPFNYVGPAPKRFIVHAERMRDR
jgi:sortase A